MRPLVISSKNTNELVMNWNDTSESAEEIRSAPALKAADLNASYGGQQVLFDVNVAFSKNKITAVMGPSGCGKSTLISALNRTLELVPGAQVVSGQVYLGGQGIYGCDISPEKVRKKIGIIYQRPLTFPMSVVENVLFGAQYHKNFENRLKRDYAIHYLEIVGLQEELANRLDEPASKLSGGQQQRLCLARTLANQPEIILMDEPCSALDPIAMRRIEKLMQKLAAEYTIIVVTHNTAQARRVSEDAIFMSQGQIIEYQSTQGMFDNPRSTQTRDFLEGLVG